MLQSILLTNFTLNNRVCSLNLLNFLFLVLLLNLIIWITIWNNKLPIFFTPTSCFHFLYCISIIWLLSMFAFYNILFFNCGILNIWYFILYFIIFRISFYIFYILFSINSIFLFAIALGKIIQNWWWSLRIYLVLLFVILFLDLIWLFFFRWHFLNIYKYYLFKIY